MAHAATAEAAFPGPNGRIAFDRGNDIWTVMPDGTGLVNLTNTPNVADRGPAWSPDGTKVAFLSNRRYDTFNIWVTNSDGSEPTVLTTNGCPTGTPAWSPDGQRLAYSSPCGG